MRLLYLTMFVSLGASAASSSYVLGKDLLSAMDAHSRAANLRPTRDSGSDEIRIWAHDYMGRRITGYVISKGSAMKCTGTYAYADGTITVNRTRCRASHTGKDALNLLDSISALDGKEWDCPMFDGAGFYIEGVRTKKRFALRVGNPDACDDSDSKVVVQVLREL